MNCNNNNYKICNTELANVHQLMNRFTLQPNVASLSNRLWPNKIPAHPRKICSSTTVWATGPFAIVWTTNVNWFSPISTANVISKINKDLVKMIPGWSCLATKVKWSANRCRLNARLMANTFTGVTILWLPNLSVFNWASEDLAPKGKCWDVISV